MAYTLLLSRGHPWKIVYIGWAAIVIYLPMLAFLLENVGIIGAPVSWLIMQLFITLLYSKGKNFLLKNQELLTQVRKEYFIICGLIIAAAFAASQIKHIPDIPRNSYSALSCTTLGALAGLAITYRLYLQNNSLIPTSKNPR
jgi:hypothetical protein